MYLNSSLNFKKVVGVDFGQNIEKQTQMKKNYQKKKILVTDDDFGCRELLKFQLEREGYEVVTAKNEREFWEQAFSGKPDLIILDLKLKSRFGGDMYENIVDFGFDPNIPVIFITGLLKDEVRAVVHFAPGRNYAFYSKPIDFEDLFQEINRLFSKSGKKNGGLVSQISHMKR